MNNTTDNNFNDPQQFDQQDFDQFDDFNPADPGQDFEEFQEEEKPKGKIKALATIGFVVVLGGIGFAGYQYYFKPMMAAQQAHLDDGYAPDNAYNTAGTPPQSQDLPPTVTSGADANPITDTLAPPPPPSVDESAGTPPLPPAVADDGTVPPGVVANVVEDEALDQDAAVTAVSNDALPAPVADAVEAPSRIATPDAVATQNLHDTIKPQLPPSTTQNQDAVTAPAAAMPDAIASQVVEPVSDTPDSVTKPVDTAVAPAAAVSSSQTTSASVSSAELQALQQKIADLPSAATIAKLNSQIDALTQRLEALDKRTETLATALQNQDVAPAAAVAAPRDVAPSRPVQDTMREDSQARESTPKAVVKPKKAAPKKAAQPARAAQGGWVLRSAQPGAAWLSKPGSEEMVRYAVGQTLPNAGTITAVTQENGRWVVKTDRGVTVRQ